MKIFLNPHGLLAIEDSSLDTGKVYHHHVQGYPISGKNEQLLVYHKKELKIMELKNLGSTMGVLYVQPGRELPSFALDQGAFAEAGQLFEAWDEELGQRYFFLPYVPSKEIEHKNQILNQLGLECKLVPSPKGVLFQNPEQEESSLDTLETKISFLFGLVILFGKLETKGEQLNAIKIHLPLFGQYLQVAERITWIIQHLQQEGIFLQTSTNEQQGQISYQITSNDWELLQMFAQRYNNIETITKITKKEQTMQAVQLLKAFMDQAGVENAAEMKALLEIGTIKILVK